MGDYCTMMVEVKDVTETLWGEVKRIFADYGGEGEESSDDYPSAARSRTAQWITACEIRLGSQDEMAQRLRDLCASNDPGGPVNPDYRGGGDGWPDFRWQVSIDGGHDWPGQVRMHIPGLGEHEWDTAEGCDSVGYVSVDSIDAILTETTNARELRAALNTATGRPFREAWKA